MAYTNDPKVIALRLRLRALPREAGKCGTYNCHTPYNAMTALVPERFECPNCGAYFNAAHVDTMEAGR